MTWLPDILAYRRLWLNGVQHSPRRDDLDVIAPGATITDADDRTKLDLSTLASRVVTESGTSRILSLSDAEAIIECTSSSAVTVTVPQDADVALPVGAAGIIIPVGTGTVTVAAGSGATLNSRGALFSSNGQWAVLSWLKLAANTFVLTGDRA